jgi:oligosaccharide reducing-end xylanase
MKNTDRKKQSLSLIKISALVMIFMLTVPILTIGQNNKKTDISELKRPQYRNLFKEAGYSQIEIDKKLAKAYYDVFEGPDKVYFEEGDSLGYVSDVKNKDARTEGMSYGMMVAVQLNKKDVFDRLWRWSVKYMQHQEGAREGYFAWSVNPETKKQNSPGSASDGELYYITSLLFASNKWGNDTGINYYKEARRILDAMWKKDGTGNVHNIINTEHKQICAGRRRLQLDRSFLSCSCILRNMGIVCQRRS